MNFEQITQKVMKVKRKYGNATAGEILRANDVAELLMPMGADDKALKGFIMKSSRMITVVINCDLALDIQEYVRIHETSNFLLGHLNRTRQAFLRDSSFVYRRDTSLESCLENEANFFTADYILDTRETLEVIREYDLLSAARILHVPPQFLDYKLRLLHGTGQFAEYCDCLSVKSSCMRTLQSGLPDCFGESC